MNRLFTNQLARLYAVALCVLASVGLSAQKAMRSATLLLLLALSTGAFAATITSSATGNWSATTTWVGGVVPLATDDVVIAATHVITLDGNYTARTLANSGTLNVAANTLTVSIASANNSTLSLAATGTLNLTGTGNIVLNGNFVTVSGASFNQSGTSTMMIRELGCDQ